MIKIGGKLDLSFRDILASIYILFKNLTSYIALFINFTPIGFYSKGNVLVLVTGYQLLDDGVFLGVKSVA